MRLFGRGQFTIDDLTLVASEPFFHQSHRQAAYEIYDTISRQLAVPARSVMVTGSAFTGRSFRENRPFQPGTSDLDVAIVDRDLFRELMLCASRATQYFRDQTVFLPSSAGSNGAETYKAFRNYAFGRGMIRPDYMPECDAKHAIFDLCSSLTNRYIEIFSSITIAIYGDEEYYLAKCRDKGDR